MFLAGWIQEEGFRLPMGAPFHSSPLIPWKSPVPYSCWLPMCSSFLAALMGLPQRLRLHPSVHFNRLRRSPSPFEAHRPPPKTVSTPSLFISPCHPCLGRVGRLRCRARRELQMKARLSRSCCDKCCQNGFGSNQLQLPALWRWGEPRGPVGPQHESWSRAARGG